MKAGTAILSGGSSECVSETETMPISGYKVINQHLLINSSVEHYKNNQAIKHYGHL